MLLLNATAIHEAAHAVAYIVLGYPLHETTVNSCVPEKVGHTQGDVLPRELAQSSNWAGLSLDEDQAKRVADDVTIFLASDIAEAHAESADYVRPDFDSPRSTDEQEIFGRIVTMRSNDYLAQDQLLQELIERARTLVVGSWRDIERVAVELEARGTLTGDEVLAVMRSATDSA